MLHYVSTLQYNNRHGFDSDVCVYQGSETITLCVLDTVAELSLRLVTFTGRGSRGLADTVDVRGKN